MNDESFPQPRIDELIASARLGSLEALWRLLALSRSYLLVVANRRIDRVLLARANPSDIVGETIIEARRDFGAFNGQSPNEWWRWLRRLLLHNLANFERDQYRKKRAVSLEVPFDGNADKLAEQLVSASTPSSLLIAAEEHASLEAALNRLSPHFRHLVLLRNRDGLTFEQIGAELQCSADAARRLWARSILQLQRELETLQ